MITDERLKELVSEIKELIIEREDDREFSPRAMKHWRELVEIYSEFLTLRRYRNGVVNNMEELRQQKKDLIAMGRGMRFELCFDDCSPSHIKTLLDDWDALIDKIDKEE